MSRNRLGILIIVILLIAAALFGWREYNRKNEPVANLKPAFELTADQLIKEFESNDSVSSAKYIGKPIQVNGIIKKIDKDEQGYVTVVLGNTSSMSSVRCVMDSAYTATTATLQKGGATIIKGMCTGFQKDDTGLLGSDIILNRCVIDKAQTK